MNACGLELQHFCRGVSPEEGKAFRCLQLSLQEVRGRRGGETRTGVEGGGGL